MKCDNTKKVKVSIGIAAYNVEYYLRRCLDSVINQTLRDIEIIVVDDGSTDKTPQICDEYSALDERVKVIHKQNGGLASARQAALDVASGKYFCALDADDWVEFEMYEKMYLKAEITSADVTMCNYYVNYTEKGKEVECAIDSSLVDIDEIRDLSIKGKYPFMVWNKMFRRSLFVDNNIGWEPNINQGEDFLIFMKVLKCPVKIAYLQDFLYHYRKIYGSNSYTNNISIASYQQLLHIREILLDNNIFEKDSKEMFRLWANLAFVGLRVKNGLSSKYYKDTSLVKVPFSCFIKYRMCSFKDMIVLLTKCTHYKVGHLLINLFYKYHY